MIWALAKWKADQDRQGHLGMIKTKHGWNKLITLEMLFKYSAHRTPTPKQTSNEERELETRYFTIKIRRRLSDALLRRRRKQSCDGGRILFERH